MIDCTFTRREDGRWECPKCGYISKKPAPLPPRKNCAPIPASRPLGLGTQLSRALARLGITKARWTWFGRKLGWLGPDENCKCPEREIWLNRLGDWVARRLT